MIKLKHTQYLLSIFVLLVSHMLCAEELDLKASSPFKVIGYLESYYSHDFNRSSSGIRPSFAYSYQKTAKPSINLAMMKAELSFEKLRANLALGSGSYMRANYAQEPDNLQKVFEANVGVKLSSQHHIWLDAGVMPSHIGFESAIGLQNWTLTRSILADNSPYFETGAKLSYTSEDGQWYASALVLNGWQRIQRANGNTTPTFGHQLTYKPNNKWTLNSSSLIGNDQSDRERKMRYFHNFYAEYHLDEKWSLLAGLDIGAQQKIRGSDQYDIWFSPVMIGRYRYSDQVSIAARAEYYQDAKGVIVETNTQHGFRTQSYSANIDYRLDENVDLRVELRKYYSKDQIFEKNDGLSRHALVLTTAMILSF